MRPLPAPNEPMIKPEPNPPIMISIKNSKFIEKIKPRIMNISIYFVERKMTILLNLINDKCSKIEFSISNHR